MAERNENTRIEAFSDGVFAFALTLLIVQIKVPPVGSTQTVEELWYELAKGWPSWFGFLLSFSIILVAWFNHHTVFKLLDKSTPQFIYANGLLLLTIVILPFTTSLMSDYLMTDQAQPGVSIYCFGKLLNNVAWILLYYTCTNPRPLAKEAVNVEQAHEVKKKMVFGTVLYFLIFILSFWFPITAMVLTTLSWIAWILLGISLAQDETKVEEIRS